MPRFTSLAIVALVGGIVGWLLRGSPTERSPTVLAELPSQVASSEGQGRDLPTSQRTQLRRSDEREILTERVEELSAALSEAQARAAKAESIARSLETSSPGLPTSLRVAGDPGAYMDPERIRPYFEAQTFDETQAHAAEADLSAALSDALLNSQLALAGSEIKCRGEICHVLMYHAVVVSDSEALGELGEQVNTVVRTVLQESANAESATIGNRSGFTGEGTTSEVFFFGSGRGVINTYRTPTGFSLAKALDF